MPELAINGGAPVRSTHYPAWPVVDDDVVASVTDVVRSGEWGGFPEPGVNGGAFEEAFAAYGLGDHGALLVRPDGHIAWRSGTAAPADAGAQLGAALDQILDRTTDRSPS